MIPCRAGSERRLREARKRRKVELSEVEAATKIRSRLPAGDRGRGLGGAARRRLRPRLRPHLCRLSSASTASALAEGVPARQQQPLVDRAAARAGRDGPWPRSSAPASSRCVVVVGVLWRGGEGGGDSPSRRRRWRPAARRRPRAFRRSLARIRPIERNGEAVDLSLTATAELWVCLLDASGSRWSTARPAARRRRGPVPFR